MLQSSSDMFLEMPKELNNLYNVPMVPVGTVSEMSPQPFLILYIWLCYVPIRINNNCFSAVHSKLYLDLFLDISSSTS